MFQWLKHWAEIAWMAAVCLTQELRGEEPDCVPCWKCESMRLLILCGLTVVVASGVKACLHIIWSVI